jgi:hypothetical protein
MSQLTATRIFNAMKGLLSGLDSTDESLLKRCLGIQWTEKVAVTDAGTSATAVGKTPFWNNDLGCNVQVVAAKFLGCTTVPGQATHYATTTLNKYESTGTTATAVGSWASDAAGGTASVRVPKALTLTASAVIVAAGESLVVDVAKAGSGVQIGTSTAPSYLYVVLEKVT